MKTLRNSDGTFIKGERSSLDTEFKSGGAPWNKGKKIYILKTCNFCKEEYSWEQTRNTGGKFCSLKCHYSNNRGENNHNWKGGYTTTPAGYVRDTRLKKYVHTIIAEKALGRKLKKGELVHHINCKKNDNRPTNLLICDQAFHRYLHAKMAHKYAEEHFKD